MVIWQIDVSSWQFFLWFLYFRDELSYTWEKWRDATGRQMRDNFKTYINIYNEAAKANGW